MDAYIKKKVFAVYKKGNFVMIYAIKVVIY